VIACLASRLACITLGQDVATVPHLLSDTRQ
jgi:hypothetical protein